jgi:hypothetical protein
MFVTSVDVEEGMMPPKKKTKNMERRYQEQDGNEPKAENGWLDPESFYADSQPAAMELQINGSVKRDAKLDPDPLYAKAEQSWSSYRMVKNWEDLDVECVIGWWVSITCLHLVLISLACLLFVCCAHIYLHLHLASSVISAW